MAQECFLPHRSSVDCSFKGGLDTKQRVTHFCKHKYIFPDCGLCFVFSCIKGNWAHSPSCQLSFNVQEWIFVLVCDFGHLKKVPFAPQMPKRSQTKLCPLLPLHCCLFHQTSKGTKLYSNMDFGVQTRSVLQLYFSL